MKHAKPIPVMKSPDMFRDSLQTFNLKTGERVSYNDREPEMKPEPVQIDIFNPTQLDLFS